MYLDLLFPVRGNELPTDHAYLLYSALSHAIKNFHAPTSQLRFAAIPGQKGGKGTIRLFERSRLRVRLPSEQIELILPLSGQPLQVGEHPIQLGTPVVVPLTLATTLVAKIVTFKHSLEASRFITTARQKLDEIGIAAEPGIPLIREGALAGQPRRKIVRIKGRQIVGYPLQVAGLTAEESLRLQEQGLGGRRRMGCGFFVPYRPRLQ